MRGIFTTTWVDSEQSEGTTPRRWLKRVAAVTAVVPR